MVITSSNRTTQLVPPYTTPHSYNKGIINKDIFPKLNGNGDKWLLWITQVDAVLEFSRWKNITIDTVTNATNHRQSQVLPVVLLNYLSKDVLFRFQSDATYQCQGMRLIRKFQPTKVEALFDMFKILCVQVRLKQVNYCISRSNAHHGHMLGHIQSRNHPSPQSSYHPSWYWPTEIWKSSCHIQEWYLGLQ